MLYLFLFVCLFFQAQVSNHVWLLRQPCWLHQCLYNVIGKASVRQTCHRSNCIDVKKLSSSHQPEGWTMSLTIHMSHRYQVRMEVSISIKTNWSAGREQQQTDKQITYARHQILTYSYIMTCNISKWHHNVFERHETKLNYIPLNIWPNILVYLIMFRRVLYKAQGWNGVTIKYVLLTYRKC